MKNINWLHVVIGAVVLYVVYKYMVAPEETSSAIGGEIKEKEKPCYCQGQFIGYFKPKRCDTKCHRANNFNF